MDKNWKELTIARLQRMSQDYLINGLTVKQCIKEVEDETPFGHTLVDIDRHYFEQLRKASKYDSAFFEKKAEDSELDARFFKER